MLFNCTLHEDLLNPSISCNIVKRQKKLAKKLFIPHTTHNYECYLADNASKCWLITQLRPLQRHKNQPTRVKEKMVQHDLFKNISPRGQSHDFPSHVSNHGNVKSFGRDGKQVWLTGLEKAGFASAWSWVAHLQGKILGWQTIWL